MSPWVIAGTTLAWAGSVAAAGAWFYAAGRDAEVAIQAREDRAAAQASAAAASAITAGLAKMKVRHTTIRQELEREVRTDRVFTDCRSGPDAVRLFNATIGAAAEQGASGAGVRAAGSDH